LAQLRARKKEKEMKKFLIIMILALTLPTMLFAGGSKEDQADSNAPLTVRMLYPDNSSYPLKDDWLVLQQIKEATGVNLELIAVPGSDYDSKMQIVFNSGDIPEICYSKTAAKTEDVYNGLLLPVSDYLDQMPNLKNFLEENDYKEDMDNLREADGKWYTLPAKADTRRLKLHSWMIRKDVFDKNNIPYPVTLDDVYAAGKKLKELYPDSYPIINRFGMNNILSMMGSGFDTSAGWSLASTGFTYDANSDKFVYAPTSENYKEMLQYMTKMLNEGILDPEFDSLDSSAYEERITQGKTFILLDWIGNQVRYNMAGKTIDEDFDVEPIFPILGKNGRYALERGTKYEQIWLIPASVKENPRFDEILSFIDWFYSDEASTITTFGVEGISYEVVDGHKRYMNDGSDPSSEYGLNNNGLCVRRDPDYFRAVNGDEIGDLFDAIAEEGCVLPTEPKVIFTEDEIEELKMLSPSITDNFSVWQSDFLYGKKSFAQWNEFKQSCQDKGVQDLSDLINKAWKRTEASK
jgi:putative aldouronate transport system substrate-binding protein